MKVLSWLPVKTLQSLPEDVIMEILSWLPVKTLLRMKSVSKSFLDLIISPEFVKLHLRRSLIRNSSVTLFNWGKAFLASFEFYLYSLKNNSWSKIESPSQGLRVDQSRTHIANNSLYWVTIKDNDLQPKVIMRFDISSHRYEEISTPKEINPAHILTVRLLKGRPHVLVFGSLFDIWMITEDNCWTPVFHCSTKRRWVYELDSPYWRNHISPLDYDYSREGRKILIGSWSKTGHVYYCDLESQTTGMVQSLGLPEVATYKYARSWAESLVPLA